MGGTTLALPRWSRDPFYQRVFRGDVLDIGGSGDSLGRHRHVLTGITHLTVLDLFGCHDAGVDQFIGGDAATDLGRQFDLVFSSHTIEHLDEPWVAAKQWWKMVKPGGYLFVIAPSWEHYERKVWPPTKNPDHRTAWVMLTESDHEWPAHVCGLLNVVALENWAGDGFVNVLRATTLDEGFDPHTTRDQTADGTCECGLEVVIQKHPPTP